MFIDSMGYILWGELVFLIGLLLLWAITISPILWLQSKISRRLNEREKKRRARMFSEWRSKLSKEKEEVSIEWRRKFKKWCDEMNSRGEQSERKG